MRRKRRNPERKRGAFIFYDNTLTISIFIQPLVSISRILVGRWVATGKYHFETGLNTARPAVGRLVVDLQLKIAARLLSGEFASSPGEDRLFILVMDRPVAGP